MVGSMTAPDVPTLTLPTGRKMPQIGVGYWKSASTYEIAATAISVGYRHFDNAAEYGNEDEVGKAIHEAIDKGILKREDVFITTKLWNADHDRVEEACEDSLKKFNLPYLDNYLMHWPVSGNKGPEVDPPLKDTWQRMEKLYDSGKVKSIGVSNFSVKKLRELLSYARIKPANLQIEAHPYWRNEDLINFCKTEGIIVTAYSPLASDDSREKMDRKDDPSIFGDPAIKELAERHGKSPAQIVLRWGLQRGTIVIPKASSVDHLQANLDILEDFELSPEDMAQLSKLQPQRRMVDGSMFCSEEGPYRSPADIWDDDGY